MKRHQWEKQHRAPVPPLPAKPPETPEEKYNRWLEAFGNWIDRAHGYKSEVAEALGISKQSVHRYFVARTHEVPTRIFFKALLWQEKKREGHQWSYNEERTPGSEFQNWNFAGRGAPGSKTGTRPA